MGPLPTPTTADWRRAFAIAAIATAIFLLVGGASGTLDVEGGFGWDGVAYARMVTDALNAGNANTAMRPLIILAVRVPYALGVDLLTSFRLVNVLSAAALFVVVVLELARRGARPLLQAAVPINLALCIATSKMFGYYPALIDLGAMAVIGIAFYLVPTGARVATAAACVAAGFSREFGIAVALYGIHHAVRRRRPWTEIAAVYLPALLVPIVLRVPVFGFVPVTASPLTAQDGITNIRLLLGGSYFAAFGYFTATVFGGLTLLLFVRLPMCVRAMRREPELLTFLVIVSVLTVAAGGDIWRYLAFALPAVVVLTADCFRDLTLPVARAVVVAMLAITVLTQRPLERMTTERYFRDWFPMYLAGRPPDERAELFRVWWPRVAVIPLCAAVLATMVYVGRRREPDWTDAAG